MTHQRANQAPLIRLLVACREIDLVAMNRMCMSQESTNRVIVTHREMNYASTKDKCTNQGPVNPCR